MIRTTLRVWSLSSLALIAASAGMSAVTASSSTISLVRMAIAAAVLSIYTAFIALLLTDPTQRSRLRCLIWGGAVPVAVGIGTAALAGSSSDLIGGLIALLPWLSGALAAWGLGPYLPVLRLPRLRRGSSSDPDPI